MKICIQLCLLSAVLAQNRGIVPEEFVNFRPGMPSAAKPVYRKSSSPLSAKAKPFVTQMGLIVWRLRPARPEDSTVRLLVHEQDGARKEWIPERVDSSTYFSIGDRLRLSLESPREGYLYVIDREEYGGGNVSEPVLIFPTIRIRHGDNRVAPGRLIDIPAQDDSPNYLRVQKSKPNQIGELLTILVTPQPIADIVPALNAQRLDEKLVAEWEKRWTQDSERFELAGAVGQACTAEQRAASVSGVRLTPADAPPQTVFRMPASGNAPVLVRVRLRYATRR